MSDHYVKFAREISNNVELLNKNFEKQNKLLKELILTLYMNNAQTTSEKYQNFNDFNKLLDIVLND